MEFEESDESETPEPPGGKKPRISAENPFLNELIVETLVKYLDFEALRTARLVCKLWCDLSCQRFLEKSIVVFSKPEHENSRVWTSNFHCDAKKPHFQLYLKCFKEGTLPFISLGKLPFENYKFINYLPGNEETRLDFGYPHNGLLSAIMETGSQPFLPVRNAVRVTGLFFENPVDPNFVTSHQRYYLYPEWRVLLRHFKNLKTLSLIGLPEMEIQKCLFEYCEYVLPRDRLENITTLCLKPDAFSSLLWPMSKQEHDLYGQILANTIGALLHLQDLTLFSNFSGGELWIILKECRTRLKSLSLGRLTPTPDYILLEQQNNSTIFVDDFPLLRTLHIPNVYFSRFQELTEKCVNLKSLYLTLQPIIINYVPLEPVNYDDHVIGTNLECITTGLSLGNSPPDHRELTVLGWQVNPHMEPVLTTSNIFLEEVTEAAFSRLAQYYSDIQVLKAFVGSAEDFKSIWRNFKQLRELHILEESTLTVTDQDFESTTGGISSLTQLQILRLYNNNSTLTEATLRSLKEIPSLRIVEIHKAPRLSITWGTIQKQFEETPLLISVFKD